MSRTLRNSLLALAAVFGTGCTHFANITEVDAADGTQTYVSGRTWHDGTPRTTVTERVYPQADEPCDMLQVQREFYDETGMLEQRVTDLEMCRVVMSRVVEDFDIAGAKITRVTQKDLDRDGRFDTELVRSEPVSDEQLAMLRAGH